MQAFLFVAGGETYQMIRGTPLRLAQAYILVNTRGWRPWCPSIQCSVPLGAGGFFPKIASQRALVARGGLCEFGARSNWPPGMPALIVFTNCCNSVNILVLPALEKWWHPISFSQKFPQLIFSPSPTLELDAVGNAWRRWFQPRTKGWCLREGRLKKVSIFVFWNIFDSYLCGRLCFAFFVISHFYGLRPIIFEVQHLCGKIRAIIYSIFFV